MRRDRILAGNV